MSLRKHSNLIIVSLILLNLALYFNGIGNDFVWDDDFLVRENSDIRDVNNLKKLLTMEDKIANLPDTGYFRPFINLTLLLDYQISKGSVYGFRLTNIAFNIASVIALFFLILLITQSRLLSFAVAAMFSAQAVHVEAVTFISGRNNVVCALFIFLSLYYYIKSGVGYSPQNSESVIPPFSKVGSRGIISSVISPDPSLKKRGGLLTNKFFIYSMLFLFLGAMSKEFAYMLPFIFILYDYSFDPDFYIKKRLKSYSAAFFTLGIFFMYRALSVPISGAITLNSHALYKRIINTFLVLASYIRNQILPNKLASYYDQPLSNSFFTLHVMFSFLFLLALTLFVIWLRKRDKVIFFSFFAYLLLLVPVSNIVAIPNVATIMADRWLYPASAFFALFLCKLIFWTFSKKETLIPVAAISFVLFLSVFTIQRNCAFKNDFLLFSDVLITFPNSSIAHNNLGAEYKKMGSNEEAERQFQLAIDCNPKNYLPYNNLADMYMKRNEYEKAFVLFKKAYKLNPAHIFTSYGLGFLYKKMGNIEESNKFYNIAISLKADYLEAYYNLALNYYEQQQYEKALEMLKKAGEIPTTEENKKKIRDNIKIVNEIINIQKSSPQQ